MTSTAGAAAAASQPFAIVTGCTRGLGRAVATSLRSNGFVVAGIARSASDGHIGDDRGPDGTTASYNEYKCDLSQPQQLESLFHAKLAAQIRGRKNRIVLVNNAGTLDPVGPTSMFGDNSRGGSSISSSNDGGSEGVGSVGRIDQAIRLNVTSPMWLSGAVVRTADAAAAVRIINISSGAADNPYPGWATYCTSKAGLRMSGQVLAADVGEFDELKGRDVRVYDYAPVSIKVLCMV